ncbi:MAG: fibrobacter succinogenes major paralogous domain-containing protein [Deltaproteobacteria bacterium]|nr:fibrobacter succinogenes major paralogous domain-containing protein [Deltaproteobacteria bacterium]
MKQRNAVLVTILVFAMVFTFSVKESFCQVTDKDGNAYKTVVIGTQEWMSENLRVEHYGNGDAIPQVQDAKEWKKLTTGAWCYYESSTENGKTYGKLYNWYAVNDPRGLAPKGWHIPSDAEWNVITDYLGGNKDAGGKLKATTLWEGINKGTTNKSGFTALPGGYSEDGGRFKFIGKNGSFWSSTQINTIAAWCRELKHTGPNIFRSSNHKRYGLSVRCVKD